MIADIDIIIPVHNSEKYIFECLRSIERQTYKNINIVIVNDNSKDNTLKIIKKFIKTSECSVTVVNLNKSVGVSAARNIGMRAGKCKYITFVDSDDELKSDHISELRKNITDDVAFSSVQIYRKSLNKNSKYSFHSHVKILDKVSTFESVLSSKGTEGYVWNKLFKRSVIQQYNIKFDSNIFICEDLLFVCSYLAKSQHGAAISNKKTYYYRYNVNGITKQKIDLKNSKRKLKNQILAYRNIDKMLVRNKVSNKILDLFNEKYILLLNYAMYEFNTDISLKEEIEPLLFSMTRVYMYKLLLNPNFMLKEKVAFVVKFLRNEIYEKKEC